MAFKTRLFGAAALAVSMTTPVFAQDASDVVATVNGVEITLGHMIQTRGRLPQQYQAMPNEVLWDGILDQLIQQQLLAEQVTEEPVRIQITIENELRSLRAGVVVDQVVTEAVTDEAVQAAYDEAFDAVEPGIEWNASHILVETEEEALAIIERLDGGEEFAALAQELSTGPSGPNGGQLGWFTTGMMVPAFEAAVVELEVGDISPPVETQFGWHVLTLNEQRNSAIPGIEDVRTEIVGQIQQEALEAHLTALEEAADVTRPEVGAFDPALLSDFSILEQ